MILQKAAFAGESSVITSARGLFLSPTHMQPKLVVEELLPRATPIVSEWADAHRLREVRHREHTFAKVMQRIGPLIYVDQTALRDRLSRSDSGGGNCRRDACKPSMVAVAAAASSGDVAQPTCKQRKVESPPSS